MGFAPVERHKPYSRVEASDVRVLIYLANPELLIQPFFFVRSLVAEFFSLLTLQHFRLGNGHYGTEHALEIANWLSASHCAFSFSLGSGMGFSFKATTSAERAQLRRTHLLYPLQEHRENSGGCLDLSQVCSSIRGHQIEQYE